MVLKIIKFFINCCFIMAIKRFDHKNMLINALKTGVNLFVGAGFSIYAEDKQGVKLPLGGTLLNELKNKFGGPNLPDLPMYCSVLEKRNKSQLNDYLINRFKVGSFDECYKNLNLINIKGVYTTNIDDLVPQIIYLNNDRYLNNQLVNGESVDPKGINYLPLHGCVSFPERGFVFSVQQIANIYTQAPRIWSYLSTAIESYPTIFIGYRLNDSGVIQAISSERTFNNAQKNMWIVLYNPEESEIEYFETLGFSIIISDTKEFLNELSNFEELNKVRKKSQNDLGLLLKSNIVPKDIREMTLRPIEDFYRGMVPKWSDILRNEIFKTSHNKTIEDSLFDKTRHTIIIGSPLSGKTTLAMQVASNINFDGLKLMFSDMSCGRAEYISKLIGDRKVLLVLDNFTDDVDAFNIFVDLPNVHLLGIDSSHNYSNISHLIEKDKVHIFNVTSLSSTDIQGIIDKIPESIRKDESEIRKLGRYDNESSIFELMVRHIRKGETIRQRYKEFINELEIENEDLAEFLVLCAYMHESHVPLSMGVAYSYFDDYNYKAVIEMRKTLADFLKEDNDDLALSDIEGFRPRSSIISDSILHNVSSNLLGKVLNKLLDKVSYCNICNYSIFHKRAFDKKIILKAFPNWIEGKEFYEKAFLYDNENPYVLQQGALYLSQHKKYQDAFSWIDRAKLLTSDKQFTIRNSHAIILFEANINVETDDAMSQLDRSMEILHKCFTDDKRKVFHATTYAEQALLYYKKYNNDKAISYLQQSKEWLEGELKENSWAYNLKELLSKTKSILK